MTCAVVCAPEQFPLRWRRACPTCGGRKMAGLDAPWYGTTWTCVGCGDSWTDGEMHERPFRRGWRAEAIARAEKVWEEAGQFTEEDHRRWLRDQLGPEGPAVETIVVAGGVL